MPGGPFSCRGWVGAAARPRRAHLPDRPRPQRPRAGRFRPARARRRPSPRPGRAQRGRRRDRGRGRAARRRPAQPRTPDRRGRGRGVAPRVPRPRPRLRPSWSRTGRTPPRSCASSTATSTCAVRPCSRTSCSGTRSRSASGSVLHERGFLEVETPMLTRSTPEGARDFLVPSRVHRGKFYALPQSPQLFKQILMVSGFEKYFQIARCFRDEDLRADRQPEFTQIDIEMSFATEEDVFDDGRGVSRRGLRAPPESTRRPAVPAADLSPRRWTLRHRPAGPPVRDAALSTSRGRGGRGFAPFEKALAGGARCGGCASRAGRPSRASARRADREGARARRGGAPLGKRPAGDVRRRRRRRSRRDTSRAAPGGGIGDGDLLLIVADPEKAALASLAALRAEAARELEAGRRVEVRLLLGHRVPAPRPRRDDAGWFPMNHPFTGSPRGGPGPPRVRPGSVRARAYDVVVNGSELGSGSIRIHRADLQERVFRALGISEAEGRERFGFLLEALQYGAPPHGGIALGLDRICAIAAGASSLRDVIAFPKTTSGIDLMTKAPATSLPEQLRELGLDAPPAAGVVSPPGPTRADRRRATSTIWVGRGSPRDAARYLVSPSGRFLLVSPRLRARRRPRPDPRRARRAAAPRPRDRGQGGRQVARDGRAIADARARGGLRRDDAFVAVGGGVVTDVAGFAAAVLLRGVAWNAVPTTTAGMADAAIGGKTGVNHARGKNLLGRVSSPARDPVDPAALRRCPTATIAPAWSRRSRPRGSPTRTSPLARRRPSGRSSPATRRRFSTCSPARRGSRRLVVRGSRASGAAAPAQLRPHARPRARGRRRLPRAPPRRGGRMGDRGGAVGSRRRAGLSDADAAACAACSRPRVRSRSRCATREARAAPRAGQEGDARGARRASCSRRSAGRGSKNRSPPRSGWMRPL